MRLHFLLAGYIANCCGNRKSPPATIPKNTPPALTIWKNQGQTTNWQKKCHTHTHENKKQQLFDSRNAYVDASLAACWDYRHQKLGKLFGGKFSGRWGHTARWAEASESPWWNLPTRTHLIHKDATITTDAYLGGVWVLFVGYTYCLGMLDRDTDWECRYTLCKLANAKLPVTKMVQCYRDW